MGEELREISGANEDFRAMEYQPEYRTIIRLQRVDDETGKASDNI